MSESPINGPEVKASKKGDAYWKSHIEKFQSSSLSKAEYCRKNDLVYSAFLYWNSKFKSSDISEGVQLVELSKQGSSNPVSFPVWPCLRVWVGEICIEIGEGFSTELFGQVIDVLRVR